VPRRETRSIEGAACFRSSFLAVGSFLLRFRRARAPPNLRFEKHSGGGSLRRRPSMRAVYTRGAAPPFFFLPGKKLSRVSRRRERGTERVETSGHVGSRFGAAASARKSLKKNRGKRSPGYILRHGESRGNATGKTMRNPAPSRPGLRYFVAHGTRPFALASAPASRSSSRLWYY